MYNLSEVEFNDVIFTNYFYVNTSADLEMINLFKQEAITPINLIGTVDANEIISQRMISMCIKFDLYSDIHGRCKRDYGEIESAVANKDSHFRYTLSRKGRKWRCGDSFRCIPKGL